ncbi:hypothetical protein NPIL_578891 [Nephila pilipes]|uniref:Uncharacterized protein n=1 Tax=Nephila pilipes TaxID=299642 RepID=A0A8X6NYR2_NEPPI|nr:hypothetical protein NPIL_578891 [Nephila pilipes]
MCLIDSYIPKSWRRITSSSVHDKSRHDAAEVFRMSTGHDCLTVHQLRIGISTTPICQLCVSGEVMERVPMWGSSQTLRNIEILGSKSTSWVISPVERDITFFNLL